MKFRFIDAEKANFPIDFMCRQFGVSRSGFYAFRDRAPSARAIDEAKLVEEVRAVHTESRGTYGGPRVHAALKGRGRATSRKRVARVMREHGLVARCKKRFRRTTGPLPALCTTPTAAASTRATNIDGPCEITRWSAA